MACATHNQVLDGIQDLNERGVLDNENTHRAVLAIEADCRNWDERDADGDCVLRHP